MANIWDAENIIDSSHALALVRKYFPSLEAQTISPFGYGFDNTAYLINNEYVFRFPRKTITAGLLEIEYTVLPIIAPNLSLQVPKPEWFMPTTADFCWPFMGYRQLPGITACHADLSEQERSALARPLALFLKQLHSQIIIPELKQILPVDLIERLDKQRLAKAITKNLELIESLKLFQRSQTLQNIVDTAHTLRSPKTTTIVHGDFYVRHLLIDKKRKITGVIDWGNLHIGDPAVDIAIAHSFLPPQAHELFKAAYGLIDEETWSLARLRALHHSCHLVLFAHDTDDSALLREGLQSLKFINLQS